MINPPSDDYVIETVHAPSVSMKGFTPRQRVAFIIQGLYGNLSPSFNMITDCLVQRGYDKILAIRHGGHDLCREIRPLFKENIEGLLGDLAKELSPDDVLFTAILGPSYTETGSLYIPLHGSSKISAVELRLLISAIPVHHAVHYVSPDVHAGDFARMLGEAKHLDFENSHIAVAPTLPAFFDSSSYHKVNVAPHRDVEVVTPFHAAFFDLADQPSLEARFRNAAQYQRQYRPTVAAYMCHGAVHPQEIAFRPAAVVQKQY